MNLFNCFDIAGSVSSRGTSDKSYLDIRQKKWKLQKPDLKILTEFKILLKCTIKQVRATQYNVFNKIESVPHSIRSESLYNNCLLSESEILYA
jgi:hypothetical protein